MYNVLVNKASYHGGNTISIGDNNMSSKRYTIPDYNNIEGASQRVYYMMDNMTSKELNVVALSYTYKAHKKNPEDKVLSAITDSLFSVLVNANSLFLNDFSKKGKAEIKADTVKHAVAAEDQEEYKTIPQMEKAITQVRKQMERAAKDLDFIEAARLRDEMLRMQKELGGMK